MSNGGDAVRVAALSKSFEVPVREAGLRNALRSVVRRQTRVVEAVHELTFRLEPGEVVGFLGPNGAGKSTTMKMLAGLLCPTAGEVRVLGHDPFRRERDYLRRMALVMGNRNQLQWDLPALDSFELQRVIYRVGQSDHVAMRDELVELLDVGALVTKPVRNLSLGERMKMEIIGALLHRPDVVFLDEPTIGLDVTMQQRIRAFVGDYSRRFGATVLLTSHDMADVEALCERIVIIDHGSLLYDGRLADLGRRLVATKTITVRMADGTSRSVEVERAEVPQRAAELLAAHEVVDITIADPTVEEIITRAFAGGAG